MKALKRIACGVLSAFTALLGISSTPLCKMTASASSDARIIVSVGDSYSSGEGIEPFYGQDSPAEDKVKNDDWLAHRSALAWSGMLRLSGPSGEIIMSEHRNENWFFAAASGATTENLTKKFAKSYDIAVDDDSRAKGTGKLAPQLDIFDLPEAGSVDYVTLTLGGNDVDFSGIIAGAVTFDEEQLKSRLGTIWDSFYKSGGIRDKIKASYKAIAEKAGSQAVIIAAGYPTLLDPNGFTVMPFVSVSAEKCRMINDAVTSFNAELKGLAEECREEGVNILFVSVEEEFAGHEAYTDDPYINPIIFGASAQELNDTVRLPNVSAYSMHPNKKGAEAYAKAVQKVIDACENGEYPPKDADPSAKGRIRADVNGSRAALSWDAVNGAESYTVYMLKNGEYKSVGTTTKTKLTVKGLKNNCTYEFLIRANADGKTISDDNAMKVSFREYFKPAPTASSDSGRITLKWDAVNGAEKYRIYQYSGGRLRSVGTVTDTVAVISGAKSGKKYTFAVIAYIDGNRTSVKTSDLVSITA